MEITRRCAQGKKTKSCTMLLSLSSGKNQDSREPAMGSLFSKEILQVAEPARAFPFFFFMSRQASQDFAIPMFHVHISVNRFSEDFFTIRFLPPRIFFFFCPGFQSAVVLLTCSCSLYKRRGLESMMFIYG